MENQQPTPQAPFNPDQQNSHKSRKKLLLIIGAVLIVVIAGIIVAIILMTKNEAELGKATTTQTTPTTSSGSTTSNDIQNKAQRAKALLNAMSVSKRAYAYYSETSAFPKDVAEFENGQSLKNLDFTTSEDLPEVNSLDIQYTYCNKNQIAVTFYDATSSNYQTLTSDENFDSKESAGKASC